MSVKERQRLFACQRVSEGTMSVAEAAGLLSISVRQMRRSIRRYEAQGDQGVVHAARGRPSNRGFEAQTRTRVIERYRERYQGFGPTLAAEKLQGDGFDVDHETLRRWLVAADEWVVRRCRAKHRSARERRHHFGELVQLDGSHHDWFEGRAASRCCLMQMVDDATGVRMMWLSEEETTRDAMLLLKAWIERYGVPKALYTDKKSVYITNREPTVAEQLAGVQPLTAFGAACKTLGIDVIAAHSPQAKGRVERANGVAQDRLIKEMRLGDASSIDEGNVVIATGFLDTRFAIEPASSTDFHRPLHRAESLEEIFRVRVERTVTNDFTLRHEGRILQLAKQPRLPRPKEKVVVAVCLDESLVVEHEGRELAFEDVTDTLDPRRRPPREPGGTRQNPPPLPGPDHPWRKMPPMPHPIYAARIYNSQGADLEPRR